MSDAIDKLKQLLGESEEADAFANTFSGLRPGGLPTTPIVWPVDSHVPTQIQQIKGTAPAQQSSVFPTTQPSRPTVAPKTTPGMVSNVRVLTKTVQTEYGEKKQVTVQFTHPPNDPYFTGANVYLHQKGAQPALVTSGAKSPLQFTTDLSSAPHVIHVTSVGNWGETDVLTSPSAHVSLVSRPSGAGTTTPPNGGLAYPTGGSPSAGYKGAWAASTTYGYGAVVNYAGTIYTSLTLANTNNNPATSPTQWQTVGNTSVFLGDWNSGTTYLPGNQVIDVAGGGGYYICIAANTNKEPYVNSPAYWQLITVGNANSFAGTYSGSASYTVGQIVEYQGAQYVCVAPTTGNTPSTSSSYWTLLGANALFMGTWSSGTAYTANMIVSYNNNLYQCILANTNEEPDNHPSYWVLTGPATLDDLEDGEIYIKGTGLVSSISMVVNNPNFQASTSLPIPNWNASAAATLAYETGTPYAGTQSLKLTTSAQYGHAYSTQTWACSPNDQFFIAAAMKSDGTGEPEIQLAFFSATGSYLNGIQVAPGAGTSWAVSSGAGTAPSNTSYCQIYLQNNATGGAGTCWFDDITVYKLVPSQFLGDWNSSTTYVPGNEVIDVAGGGGFYTALQLNTNEQPSASPAYWQLVTAGNLNSFEGTYNGSTSYTVGEIVEYAGAQYVCIAATTGNTPSPSSAYWALIGANALFMGTWSSGTAYTANMVVVYGGNLYQAVQASTNQTPSPTSSTYWALTGPATLDDLVNGDFYVKGTLYTGQSYVVQNPNFAGGTAGWIAGGTGFGGSNNPNISIAQSTATPYASGTSCEVSLTSAAGQLGFSAVQYYKVTPGDYVVFSFYGKSDGTFSLRGTLEWFESNGTGLGENDLVFGTGTSWAIVEYAVTVPANASYAILGFYDFVASGVNRSAWVTDVQLACSGAVVPGGASSLLNGQGNIPASSSGTGLFECGLKSAGATDESGLAIDETSTSLLMADGSIINVGGSRTVPSAPSLSQFSGGSLSAQTYYVRVALIKDGACMSLSAESSINMSANNFLEVTSPAAVAGYDGWIVLIYGATNEEIYVTAGGSVNVTNPLFISAIAFGTNFTQTGQFTYYTGSVVNVGTLVNSSGGTIISSSSSSWAFPFALGLTAGDTLYLYPFYDQTLGMIRYAGGIQNYVSSATYAIYQSGDGRTALSAGSLQLAIPSSGSHSGSSVGGGGGGGRGLL
jgi:hypothetical protein